MLHLARKVVGTIVHAVDGDVGKLEDFYFDQKRWAIRYLLVDTGSWMNGKRVLLSPMSVAGRWDLTTIPLRLTREQVWKSPEFDSRESLSRDAETLVLGYYGYPYYWGYSGIWGAFDNPGALLAAPPNDDIARQPTTTGIDPAARHLYSVNKSTGYHLQANDGEIGHVDDFLIGEESWRIRYLLVDTSNWIGGRSVIISTEGVDSVDADQRKLRVCATRGAIKNGPAFESIEAALDTRETGPPFTFI